MRSGSITAVALSAIFVLVLSSAAFAQTMVEPQVPAPQPDAGAALPQVARPSGVLKIGAGDLIEVSVYGVSDYKQEARVSDSGDVSLPLVGSVTVAGMTVEEAQTAIAKALVSGGYFRDPHVIVMLKEFASQGVSVMGEVMRPGVYPVMGTRRLYDLVSIAGGFSPKAGRQVTITHRDNPDQPESVMINNDPAKSIEANVPVYPGDTIVVSRAGVVYVVGDVGRPGGYVMENSERMTVLEALALAQGVNRTAALNAARVIRRGSGKPEEVKIPLKKIMAAKESDVELMPNDILFIPGSAAKSAAKRGVDSIVQVATSLAIFGVR